MPKPIENLSHISGLDNMLTANLQFQKSQVIIELKQNPSLPLLITAHALLHELFIQLSTSLRKEEEKMKFRRDLNILETLIQRAFITNNNHVNRSYLRAAMRKIDEIEYELKSVPQKYQVFVRKYEQKGIKELIEEAAEQYAAIKTSKKISKEKYEERKAKEGLLEMYTKKKEKPDDKPGL